eukprot:6187863-Pleurochrysis_carterae.AAC.1
MVGSLQLGQQQRFHAEGGCQSGSYLGKVVAVTGGLGEDVEVASAGGERELERLGSEEQVHRLFGALGGVAVELLELRLGVRA